MWLTTVSIKRPLFMLMVIGATLVMGFVSWSRLGVDLFPALDYPVVSVTTVYPGAGPDAVDTLVTRPVEDAVAGMNNLDYIQSTSVDGVSTVIVFFTEKAGKDTAIDVERRINTIRGQLPRDIQAPVVGTFDPNAQPVISLAISGDRDLGQLQAIAEDPIQKRLEATDGVGRASVIGGLERVIEVQVSQDRLQARGLSILQVNQALAADNLDVPAGSMTQAGKDWNVRLSNQAQKPAELGNILLTVTPGGTPVFLRDVATVRDTYKEVSTIQRSTDVSGKNSAPAVGITVVKQSSANTITTVDAVKATLAEVQPLLPADVKIDVVDDQSIFTRNSVHDVQTELSWAIALTALVLLVFLHTFRSTIIVLLAIPTSLISTLAVMYFMGFSLNMMSLMGLTLTVGILVDDSIVVLENIFRRLHLGEEPHLAAITGRSEIGLAAIAITLVDVVVFTPIAFMDGIVGQYFRQFGLVIAVATLFSLFVSFTLTPMLASRWLRKGESGEVDQFTPTRNPLTLFARLWDRGYARLERLYGRTLGWALHHRWWVVAGGVLSFVAGISLAATGVLPAEFMPEADEGNVQVTVELPAGTALAVTDEAARTIEQQLYALPEVRQVFTSVGVGGSGGFGVSQARFASINVQLVGKGERTRSSQQLANLARQFSTGVPGAVVRASQVSLFTGGAASVAVRINGEDADVLQSLASQVSDVVRRTAGTSDVSDGGVTGDPELIITVDRERAADLGLTPGQVASVLRTGLAGSTVGTFRPEGTTGWDISVILEPDDRARVEQITDLPIVTPGGATIRLGQVARITTDSGPTEVNRRDRQRLVTVTAALTGERVLSTVSEEIQNGINAIDVPAGYTITQGGLAAEQDEAFGAIFQALGLSVLMMYMLMVALFESLLFPMVIMLSLPLAVVGAFGLLALTGNSLNMMSMIGMILLTGLVGKNAILLVDYTNTLRKRGVARDDALREAGPTRLRPILMTTAALVLAMSPLALKIGEGAEWRAPMAVTVIGGLITSTLLTLVLVPSVYTILDDAQKLTGGLPARVRRRFTRTAATAAPEKQPRESPVPAERPRHPAPHVPVPVAGASE